MAKKKFNLKWKDFQSNVTNTFKTLRTFDHFYDDKGFC